MNRFYFTLKQILTAANSWNHAYESGNDGAMLIEDYLMDSGIIYPTTEQTSEIANTLWCKYIVPRFAECYPEWSDESPTPTADNVLDFARHYLNIFNLTYDRYASLVDIYKNNRDKLMENIKTITENKYNDTPQNMINEYSWGDDGHLSNISKSTFENELTTKMARLAEIERDLKSIYKSWSDEFRKLFIYE